MEIDKKILDKLEDMISEHIINSVEVDISAKEIYDMFILPLLKLNENYKSQINTPKQTVDKYYGRK